MMMIYLIGVALWGFAVSHAELQFTQILRDGEIDLGPYYGVGNVGVIPPISHLHSPDEKATENVRRLLELLRVMPFLDPFISRNIDPLNLNVPLLSGKVDILQIMITGLQKFRIDRLAMYTEKLRTDFVVKVPEINAAVNIQANLAIGGLIPVSIDGILKVNLVNVVVEGALAVTEKYHPRHHYSVTALNARLTADSVRVSLVGLDINKDILEALQSSELFDSNKPLSPAKIAVNYYVANEVVKQINNILERFPAKEVKAYVLSP